jgi:hypothetical protein
MEKEETTAPGSDSETGFVCIATFLPLRSWKYIISFQLMTWKVLKQVKRSEGIVNYAVKANFPKMHFWTFSIWKDKGSLLRFTSKEPHATAIKKFERWAGEGSAFVEWTSTSHNVDCREALRRLQNPTFYYHQKEY